jgi:23S rRNA (guanine745-N1)-methyltransferase
MLALHQEEVQLRCPNKHSFDIAREGYVNLLRKPLPGDTREMLLARRQFLEQGYYQPVASQIVDLLDEQSFPGQAKILDAGCGEGYYLEQVRQHLSEPILVGMDIAKDAIRMAAKRYRAAHFVVASIKERFVFLDEVFDGVLNIFAPRNVEEFRRVLRPGGLLLCVIPDDTHLASLRSAFGLLQIEENKIQHVKQQLALHFSLLTTRTCHYPLALSGNAARQLVMMTPNYWHLSPETHQRLDDLVQFQTEVAVSLLLFQRCP